MVQKILKFRKISKKSRFWPKILILSKLGRSICIYPKLLYLLIISITYLLKSTWLNPKMEKPKSVVSDKCPIFAIFIVNYRFMDYIATKSLWKHQKWNQRCWIEMNDSQSSSMSKSRIFKIYIFDFELDPFKINIRIFNFQTISRATMLNLGQTI